MPLIDLAKSDFGSLTQKVPRLKLSNMYIVENPISLSGVSYVSRPSLSVYSTVASGSIVRGIYCQDGQGKTNVYTVIDTSLYLLNSANSYTNLGAIQGTDLCSFASSIYHTAIVSGGNLYLYDGTTLTNVVIPDGLKVSDVTSLDNYFIVSIIDSNKFYWVAPGDTTIDPLNFTSAERNPDDIVTVTSIGDEMWAIGQSTVEIFTDSGDPAAPFIRIGGRVYTTGCADRNSLARCNKDSLPCLIWVTPTKEVVLAQGVPNRISDESVEELLKLSSTFTAWSFRTNRHDFYILTTDNETLVFDITVGTWYRWSSYMKETWDASLGLQVNDTIYCTNNKENVIYTLSSNRVDGSSDYIVCEVSGFIPNSTNNSVVCQAVTLFLNYGYTPDYTDGPLIEMRWSDNSGASWVEYYQETLGLKGGYETTSRFRSLGSFNRPGRYFEFRFSQISSFRLDGVTLNDSV